MPSIYIRYQWKATELMCRQIIAGILSEMGDQFGLYKQILFETLVTKDGLETSLCIIS